jgi:hypothetical protein
VILEAEKGRISSPDRTPTQEEDNSGFGTPPQDSLSATTSFASSPISTILGMIENLTELECKSLIVRANNRLQTLEKLPSRSQRKVCQISSNIHLNPNALSHMTKTDSESLLARVKDDLKSWICTKLTKIMGLIWSKMNLQIKEKTTPKSRALKQSGKSKISVTLDSLNQL